MAQRIKVDFKSGFRITEEVMDALGVLARDLLYAFVAELKQRPENYGVIVNGLEEDDVFRENRLFPKIVGNKVIVSSGACITREKKFVVITEELAIDLPSEGEWMLWLLVDENKDTSIVIHDIEGNIDYPVYVNSGYLEWKEPGMSPVKDGIKLGQLERTGDELSWTFNKETRNIFVLIGSLLWVGDKDKNIITFEALLEPSVEPGVSLHRFLACKGSGIRTIKNPFALTFDDIQGEPFLVHNRFIFKAGVIFAEEGIRSNFLPVFQDKKYVPLYPKVQEINNEYYLVFCVSRVEVNGDYKYVCDDIYGSDATQREGYIISGGYLRRYLKDYKLSLQDVEMGKDYLVWVEYDVDLDAMIFKMEEETSGLWKTLERENKLVICRVREKLPTNGRAFEITVFNYAYVINSANVRLSLKTAQQRFGLSSFLNFNVDGYLPYAEYLYANLEKVVGYELVRRRGVKVNPTDLDYETLKGTFVIYDKSASLNLATGHFNYTDNSITLQVAGMDDTMIKVVSKSEGESVWSFMNQWGFTAQFKDKKASLTTERLKIESEIDKAFAFINRWGINIETLNDKAVVMAKEFKLVSKNVPEGADYRAWFRVWETIDKVYRMDLGYLWFQVGNPYWNGFTWQMTKTLGKWSIILDRPTERKWFDIVQFEKLENIADKKKILFNPSGNFEEVVFKKDFTIKGTVSYIPEVYEKEEKEISGLSDFSGGSICSVSSKGYTGENEDLALVWSVKVTGQNITDVCCDLVDLRNEVVKGSESASALNMPFGFVRFSYFRKDNGVIRGVLCCLKEERVAGVRRFTELSIIGYYNDGEVEKLHTYVKNIDKPNRCGEFFGNEFTPYITLDRRNNNGFIVMFPVYEYTYASELYIRLKRFFITVEKEYLNVSEEICEFITDRPIENLYIPCKLIFSYLEIHNDTELYLKPTSVPYEIVFFATLYYGRPSESVHRRTYACRMLNINTAASFLDSVLFEHSTEEYVGTWDISPLCLVEFNKDYGRYIVKQKSTGSPDEAFCYSFNYLNNIMYCDSSWKENWQFGFNDYLTCSRKKYFTENQVLIGQDLNRAIIFYLFDTEKSRSWSVAKLTQAGWDLKEFLCLEKESFCVFTQRLQNSLKYERYKVR